MLPTKDPHQTWRHIQTVSGTVGKYSMQMELEKKSWSSNTHLRENGLRNCCKTQERTLYNDQWTNLGRRYNNCKYIYIQPRSTSIKRAKPNIHKKIN